VSSEPEPSPAALARALAARGLAVRVEAVGRLAVVRPLADAPVDWAAERREVVRLAAQHGFSNAALELP
jgi:hypothetical protein